MTSYRKWSDIREEIVMQINETRDALVKILTDLDRCMHGRHRADPCLSCPDGQSAGNPQLPPPGAVVGYDRAGRVYVVPPVGRSFADPDAWRVGDGHH